MHQETRAQDTGLSDLLDAGRHAFDEDAGATPIFSSLTRGGWRRRQREAMAEEYSRIDPLTAPLPIVAAMAVPPAREGRHHRRREQMDTYAWGISA